MELNQSFDMNARCPAECPYSSLAPDLGFCSAACVRPSSCVAFNPDAPVEDASRGICRGAQVDGCFQPSLDGTDRCITCGAWYDLSPDGQCRARYMWAAWTGLCLVAALACVLVAYVVDLNLRASVNPSGLACGLQSRSMQKYRSGPQRDLWPLTTNLCVTPVGGPGLLLYFNFLAAVIVWSAVIGFGWLIMAYVVDVDLLILGRKEYGTPYRNCVLVAWGFATQQRLMWAKLSFLLGVYIVTFFACLLHGVRQRRLFQQSDVKDTMKAFAVLMKGLPEIRASEAQVEAELSDLVSSLAGQPVVGVSVCWNFSSQQEQVKALLDKSFPSQATATAGPSQEMESGGLRRAFLWAEKIFLKCLEEEVQTDSVQQLLQKVPSSAEAFVVFETRSSRDIALAALPETVQFRGSSLSFSAARHEPRGIYWQNYSRSSVRAKCWKITKGLFCIAAGLTTWGCIFYLPYVWSVLTFNYEGGRQPGLIYNLCFSVIVVVGNASMYEICARVADNVGFKYKETREACYMILYLVSVSLNIILDLVMTYQMSFAVMVHMGFRTHDGTPLSKLPYFVQRFEAYAIQRAMGQNLYEYAFPSTFLVPFVCEPLVTIYGLLRVGILLVRSHPEMRPMLATQLLSANDFEFGRYADSLLNISLAVMMFFFPGGYTHWIFLMLSVCQAYIYLLDHWRILRVVPAATFASMQVDWWCQAMLAPSCGLLAACLVFKGNCQGVGYCMEAQHLILTCVAAGVLHTVVHVLLLLFLVPRLASSSAPVKAALRPCRFEDVAAEEPCTWFSANPVHCLRSKCMNGHSPCSFFVPGQEQMVFSKAKSAKAEDASSFEMQIPDLPRLQGLREMFPQCLSRIVFSS